MDDIARKFTAFSNRVPEKIVPYRLQFLFSGSDKASHVVIVTINIMVANITFDAEWRLFNLGK